MLTIASVPTHPAITLRLALAVLFGSTTAAPVLAQAVPALEPPAVCVGSQLAETSASSALGKTSETRFAGDAFVRTELFFGSERPNLPQVSADEFKEFLDAAVTPCFPD